MFRELTTASLNCLVDRIIPRLRERGLGTTSKVALYFPHPDCTYELIPTLVSLMTLGANVTLLSQRLTDRECSEILDIAQTTAIIAHAANDTTRRQMAYGTPDRLIISFAELLDLTDPSVFAELGIPANPASPDPAFQSLLDPTLNPAAAINVATSGSSGTPKIVHHSALVLTTAAKTQAQALKITDRSRLLASLSPCHIGGLMIIMRALVQEATLIVPCRASRNDTTSSTITEILAVSEATHCSLVPAQLLQLLATNGSSTTLPHLQSLLIGGAPSSPKLLGDALSRGLPLQISYGMTETAALVTLSRTPSPTNPLNVGYPIDDVIITIIDENTNDPLPHSISGKITISSPSLFTSYIGKDSQLRASLRPFITSDLGYLDRDGSLVVLGRSDRMIISGGLKVSPAEIEHAARSFPGVLDAAVCPVPDAKWGERPGLVVEVQEGVAAMDHDISRKLAGHEPSHFIEELRAFLRKELGRTKTPERIVITNRLPRIGVGKVDYQAIRRELVES